MNDVPYACFLVEGVSVRGHRTTSEEKSLIMNLDLIVRAVCSNWDFCSKKFALMDFDNFMGGMRKKGITAFCGTFFRIILIGGFERYSALPMFSQIFRALLTLELLELVLFGWERTGGHTKVEPEPPIPLNRIRI